jgi:hypothetical protein
MSNLQNNKDLKEEFCAPCAALIPAAIGLGGAGVSGGTSGGKNKKMKNIIFWSSIGLTVISIIVFIWLKTRCTSCR